MKVQYLLGWEGGGDGLFGAKHGFWRQPLDTIQSESAREQEKNEIFDLRDISSSCRLSPASTRAELYIVALPSQSACKNCSSSSCAAAFLKLSALKKHSTSRCCR